MIELTVRAGEVRMGDVLLGPNDSARGVLQVRECGAGVTLLHGRRRTTEISDRRALVRVLRACRVVDHDAPALVHRVG